MIFGLKQQSCLVLHDYKVFETTKTLHFVFSVIFVQFWTTFPQQNVWYLKLPQTKNTPKITNNEPNLLRKKLDTPTCLVLQACEVSEVSNNYFKKNTSFEKSTHLTEPIYLIFMLLVEKWTFKMWKELDEFFLPYQTSSWVCK